MKKFFKIFIPCLSLMFLMIGCKKNNDTNPGGPSLLGPAYEGYLATIRSTNGKKDTLILTGGNGGTPRLIIYHKNLVDLGEVSVKKDYMAMSYQEAERITKIRFSKLKPGSSGYVQYDGNLAIWDKSLTVPDVDHLQNEYQLANEGQNPYGAGFGETSWIVEKTTGDNFTVRSADFQNVYLCSRYMVKRQGSNDYSYNKAMGLEGVTQDWFLLK